MYQMKKNVLNIAIAAAIAGIPAAAMAGGATPGNSEVIALKKQLKILEETVASIRAELRQNTQQAQQAKAELAKAQAAATSQPTGQVSDQTHNQAPSAGSIDVAEFNRIRIKTEGLDEALEANGFKALKISGYVDPSYIYNRNAKTSSFVFLNNNSSINGSDEVFAYDNSFFGSGMLNLEKELEGGSEFKLSLMPSKGAAAGYNFGNLVHEASMSVPLTDSSTRLLAGQIPDWSGYEAMPSPQNKLITHNLLFDFSAANFYTGAGLELVRGLWNSKILIGNLNRARIDTAKQQLPGIFYRVDYSKDEFKGIGFSGSHTGFDDKLDTGRLDLLEVDGYFTRGDWNFQGQLAYGRQGATESNAYTRQRQHWYGLSALASYKVTARLEAIARFDHINNARNGGGLFGSSFDGLCKDSIDQEVSCPDGRNGFGSSMMYNGESWVVQDPNRGSNRSALSLGLNYALLPGVSLRAEYRYDRSTGQVFKTSDSQYKRDNQVIGMSTILSF